jgi:hypothetical protein
MNIFKSNDPCYVCGKEGKTFQVARDVSLCSECLHKKAPEKNGVKKKGKKKRAQQEAVVSEAQV